MDRGFDPQRRHGQGPLCPPEALWKVTASPWRLAVAEGMSKAAVSPSVGVAAISAFPASGKRSQCPRGKKSVKEILVGVKAVRWDKYRVDTTARGFSRCDHCAMTDADRLPDLLLHRARLTKAGQTAFSRPDALAPAFSDPAPQKSTPTATTVTRLLGPSAALRLAIRLFLQNYPQQPCLHGIIWCTLPDAAMAPAESCRICAEQTVASDDPQSLRQ